ncbi:hypothetical protein RM553_14815 [Zunongwangia sp. F363]|uniref:DUF2116 family Zn-ribbon domain-containing protein n=1 Tax=Autumnicola tepida TaxID=3075595 RepID=A0ABU3CCN4_9FLAO|nr:hypothetical protein [Zunongwangia sp. F363]MDT0644106.1 hypothetical protein [Zunongwangia sp. F363]
MQKNCLECGEKLVGREDKKFCSDSCRNAHHNKANRNENVLIKSVNAQLRKNYKILQELNPENKGKTSKSRLQEKGFSFNHITSIYKTKTGTVYYFVYDQGYLPLENDFYALVKKN